MFTSMGRCCTREVSPTPALGKPPGDSGEYCVMDGWSRFYLDSAMMHPTEDTGVDTEHLAAFDGGCAPRKGLKMNSQGMGFADLSKAMRVAKEAEEFFDMVCPQQAACAT